MELEIKEEIVLPIELIADTEEYLIYENSQEEINWEFIYLFFGKKEKKSIKDFIKGYIKEYKIMNFESGISVKKMLNNLLEFFKKNIFIEDKEMKNFFNALNYNDYVNKESYYNYEKIYSILIILEILNTSDIMTKKMWLKRYNFKNELENFKIINVLGKQLVILPQEYSKLNFFEEIDKNLKIKKSNKISKLEKIDNSILKEIIIKRINNDRCVSRCHNFSYDYIFYIYTLLNEDEIFFYMKNNVLYLTLEKIENDCNVAIKFFIKKEISDIQYFFLINQNMGLDVNNYIKYNNTIGVFMLKLSLIAIYESNSNLEFYNIRKKLFLMEKIDEYKNY